MDMTGYPLARVTYTLPGRHPMAPDITRTEVGYIASEGNGYLRLQDRPVAWNVLRSIPVGRVVSVATP